MWRCPYTLFWDNYVRCHFTVKNTEVLRRRVTHMVEQPIPVLFLNQSPYSQGKPLCKDCINYIEEVVLIHALVLNDQGYCSDPQESIRCSVFSMKITNKPSMVRIEKSFIWDKLKTVSQERPSHLTPRNCSREARFSCLSEQRAWNKSGIHSWKVSRKTAQDVHSQSVWLWHLGRQSYHQGRATTGTSGRDALNPYF